MIPKQYDKYEKTVTIACVSYLGVWGDKAANLEKIKTKVRDRLGKINNV